MGGISALEGSPSPAGERLLRSVGVWPKEWDGRLARRWWDRKTGVSPVDGGTERRARRPSHSFWSSVSFGSPFRGTEGYVNSRSRHNLRVRSTNQHQSRTCGGFRSNAFVRQTNPKNLERCDVYPVALNFDQVGIFTLETGADDSSFYFSLHAPSSQGGFTTDLLLPLQFGCFSYVFDRSKDEYRIAQAREHSDPGSWRFTADIGLTIQFRAA
jgi:hypothetical protein